MKVPQQGTAGSCLPYGTDTDADLIDETAPLQPHPKTTTCSIQERSRQSEIIRVCWGGGTVAWLALAALAYLIALSHLLLYRLQEFDKPAGRSHQVGSFWARGDLNHERATKSVQPNLLSKVELSSSTSNDQKSYTNNPVGILIVYGPEEDPWQKIMAQAIYEGCQSAASSDFALPTNIQLKTVASATCTFQDVLAADAVILGSSVENANVHPAVQQWIDRQWDITRVDGSNAKLGAAFVTAGGITAGQESTLNNLLKTMMVFRMILVGGETWESSFGVAAITAQAPFMPYPENDDSDDVALFPPSCYLPPGQLVSPMFLDQARRLGSRVANVAQKLNR
ncbi:fgfr1op N-terminal like [Seminavis robusta]|uniref:Fgfr1op N-terminal like n=1 Tax=Seminavis robusta TaxID=568900 RepID=A0A9N8ETN2_9STRA|nr:fgfr1op N-terminal like [Seminavis robusta]|eukprot:Sro1918_g305420.1 fgfr1op N-terminal like (339) ;mRNA; f:18722-19738